MNENELEPVISISFKLQEGRSIEKIMNGRAARPASATTLSCGDVDMSLSMPISTVEQVRGAERAFVERKYGKALKLANHVLQNESQECALLPPITNCVHLRTAPIEFLGNQFVDSADRSFLVDFSCTFAPVDRAAAVSLQCCYEISLRGRNGKLTRSEFKGVQPFLDYYFVSEKLKRTLPFEVATLWIKFCYAIGFNHTAVEMAAELLHVLLSRKDAISPLADSGQDELLWFFLTKALPHSMNCTIVGHVFDQIEADSWTPLQLSFAASRRLEQESISTILSRLEDLSDKSSNRTSVKDCISQCQRQLKFLLNEVDGNSEGKIVEDEGEIPPIAPSFLIRNRNRSQQLPMACTDWQRQVAKRILQLFRIHVIEPLYSDKERWANRGRVAIAAFMTYLAWKRRRRIKSATQSVGQIVMSPFSEIVQALLPMGT